MVMFFSGNVGSPVSAPCWQRRLRQLGPQRGLHQRAERAGALEPKPRWVLLFSVREEGQKDEHMVWVKSTPPGYGPQVSVHVSIY